MKTETVVIIAIVEPIRYFIGKRSFGLSWYDKKKDSCFSVPGARSTHTSILVKLQELNEAQSLLQSKNAELKQVIKELDSCKKVADK